MKGLELAEKYYNAFGKEMLECGFADVMDRVTVGLVGEGSECLGYDDEKSADHDFEPGFCLWIDDEDEKSFGFRLERAYSKLPKEFEGYKRSLMPPADGPRHGVFVTEDFYKKYIGTLDLENPCALLHIPSYALASVTNGKVFKEGSGKFMSVRNRLLAGYPEDVRLKKLAACLASMEQSGKYNYYRCVSRGENGGGQLALFEYVKSTIYAIYLLNNKYCPFYKWAFRGMRDLPVLSDLELPLTSLIENSNEKTMVDFKLGIIEDTSDMVIEELKRQGLTSATCNNLDTHAFSLMDSIKDASIRNMHITEGLI